MNEKKKLKLKKFYFHPITTFLFLTILVIVFSRIFSLFEMQATYKTVDTIAKDYDRTLITVENILSLRGIRYILSSALKNFVSFLPLGTLIISLFALTISEATGFIETLTKKYISKIPRALLTFIILFLATSSSLINEVGYAILIPLVALIYFINNRNPILGIITAFCGVSFGYGVSLFVGTQEIALIPYTKNAAILINEHQHIALTSNLFFIVAATFIVSIIGTIIIEKILAPKIGKYKREEEFANTERYNPISLEEEEQKEIEREKREKKGMRFAIITAAIFLLASAYALIPGLPGSGILLDKSEKLYVNMIFGENAYFQESFSFMVALFIILTSFAYALGAKSLKNDKELVEKINVKFSKTGSIFFLMFIMAQFVAIFRKTNIGIVITTWMASIFEYVEMNGIVLIIVALILIALSNFVLTSGTNKWIIFSPVMVPIFMQSNISAEFAQIVLRAGDSMTKGFTPLLASFAIYIGYLNIYNLNKDKPITIRKSLQLITPYFLLISVMWIVLVVGWYIIGLPIGPGVYPTI